MVALPIPTEPRIRVLVSRATVATIVATTADEHDGSECEEEGDVEVTVELDLHELNRAVLRARASAASSSSASSASSSPDSATAMAAAAAASEGVEMWDGVVQDLCIASRVVELVRSGEMDPVESAEGGQGESDGSGSQSVGGGAEGTAGGDDGCRGKLLGFNSPVPAQNLGSCLRGLYQAWIEPFNEYRGDASSSVRDGWAAKLASARESAATEAALDEVSEAEAAPEIAVGTRFWRYFPDEKRCLQGTVSTAARGKGSNASRVMRAVVTYDHESHVLPTTPIRTKGAGDTNGDGVGSRGGGKRGAGGGGGRSATRGFSKVMNGSAGSPMNKGRKGKGKAKAKETPVVASESEYVCACHNDSDLPTPLSPHRLPASSPHHLTASSLHHTAAAQIVPPGSARDAPRQRTHPSISQGGHVQPAVRALPQGLYEVDDHHNYRAGNRI